MKKEVENLESSLMRIELSMAGKLIKTAYVKLGERLGNIIEMYEEDGSIVLCLKLISNLQKLEWLH